MNNFLKGRLLTVRICLLLATFALIAIGIATIYAVGHPAESSPSNRIGALAGNWKKQVVFAAIGFAGFLVVNAINYRRFGAVSYWIFAGIIVLLVLLLVSKYIVELPFARPKHDTYRWIWIEVGGRTLPSLQPSELCKLAYILALAWYLRYRSNYRRFKALLGPFILTFIPMVLILLEPDLGTVMLMMPVLFTMLFVAGAKVKHLLLIILMAMLISPIMWFKMRPYQRIRISSVLLQSEKIRSTAEEHEWFGQLLVGEKFTEKEWRTKWGYHLIRSKYAIASGGIDNGTGYGFRKGPFVKYDFLDERHNDFIFAIIAQQWGFWGSLILLVLYIIILACGLEIASNNTDPFGRLLAVGIVAMFVVEIIENIGMTMGIMPITGLTLPFISYGGSSLLVNMMAVGMLNNIGRCRPFTLARKN
ncbi:MAG: rod shape-determining protein RodA [Sedimentisphaerales bacterium]|nr:rod shape-determining protein RodA [Sedimentisphaerales bacterium]